MDDNRTIMHEQRFILSNNILDPKVYQVTKITDLSPQGIIKLSVKQDEFNRTKDNIELGICDYYTNIGETKNTPELLIEEDAAIICSLLLNDNNELQKSGKLNNALSLGNASYYSVVFPESSIKKVDWKLELIRAEDYDKPDDYYANLIRMESISDNSIMLKPGKAKSLIGKTFKLTVSDPEGHYYSSIDLEVTE